MLLLHKHQRKNIVKIDYVHILDYSHIFSSPYIRLVSNKYNVKLKKYSFLIFDSAVIRIRVGKLFRENIIIVIKLNGWNILIKIF